MPISFSRLRIAGFKSFAEPVVVEMRPGLTGIVGPNGCGKSNVVEALRWAMGENSARSLRGGEMDDVIFAGSVARPSRNLAEVALTLGDSSGAGAAIFPPPFQNQAELEISRRIERGGGSVYRVNGREVRARDVQTLFADLASGARSSAMVSQGRVAAIVNTRPEERRSILEEAAGITGLHARRHEAELKLRAAETNLARAEDLRGQLEQQLQGLKRQARQASRYRNISGAVRAAEAELLALTRARAGSVLQARQEALRAAHIQVADCVQDATAATTRVTSAVAALPALRQAEAASRTAVERHRLLHEQSTEEARRAEQAVQAAAQRLAQLGRDLLHAEQARDDAAAAQLRLREEAKLLTDQATAHPMLAETAVSTAAAASEAVRLADQHANRATEHAAELDARGRGLRQELAQAEGRFNRLRDHLQKLTQERGRVVMVPADRLDAVAKEQEQAEAAQTAARSGLESAEQARSEAQAAKDVRRDIVVQAELLKARLSAEAQALGAILAVRDGEKWPPMVDALAVPEGMEAALGAALGEELESAENPQAARHWRELGPLEQYPQLPTGTTALVDLVQAPPALHRALSQIGLVEDADSGMQAQSSLAAGQALVCRAGSLWRWDGYTILAGTPMAASVRLQQRNRLAVLQTELLEAEQVAVSAGEGYRQAESDERIAVAAEQQARTSMRQADQTLERTRNMLALLRSQASAASARSAALDEQIGGARIEYDEANDVLHRVQQARSALPDVTAARADVEQARATLSISRALESKCRAECETLERARKAREARQVTIGNELADWSQRAGLATSKLEELRSRRREAESEHTELVAIPASLALRRAEMVEALEQAETTFRHHAGLLADAERESENATRAERANEAALAAARETVVRAESLMVQAEQAWQAVAERIVERLGEGAAMPDPPSEISAEAETRATKRLERLQKEREEMGPVNLRAEIEAEAVEQQMAAIVAEGAELSSAIAKLRGSIGHLNREGRERLSAIFQQVDQHFQNLFSRMFGGGRAHLALVGSDDPLAAGLEIYAQPPGKKLATLSLLSGGEQALTALSLIFAVFRCNPAPVCVLDEVDAPLDDANVDRFCALLEDMVKDTGTRFLVVTHHHLTMAKMDRLYGVTMQERGVSRLLSVDLQRAAELVDQPRLAAE
jgi:chromosome segregation protein